LVVRQKDERVDRVDRDVGQALGEGHLPVEKIGDVEGDAAGDAFPEVVEDRDLRRQPADIRNPADRICGQVQGVGFREFC
jgi:hypothetical protein